MEPPSKEMIRARRGEIILLYVFLVLFAPWMWIQAIREKWQQIKGKI